MTQGADLEREYFHYVFADDMAALPARLQQIVETRKGRFIDHDRIISIINSLDTMVLRESDGMLPRPVTAAPPRQSHRWDPPVPLARGPTQYQLPGPSPGRERRFRWPRFRLPKLWKIPVGAVVLFAVMNAVVDLDGPPRNQVAPVPQATQAPASMPATAPQARPAAPKPPAKDTNAALPSFIAPSSAMAVERAIVGAQDQAVYASWQSGTQKGLVLLLEIDSSGCGRYQITRTDLQPPLHEVVRRCPQRQQ